MAGSAWMAIVLVLACAVVCGCAETSESNVDGRVDRAPPERTQVWMDRLTVEHEYDPDTGFIVARETIGLPAVLADGPEIGSVLGADAEAMDDRLVVVFATADRCAPCQQYKKDALNDGRVIAVLEDDRVLATHVEVDRQADVAEQYLGSRGIPMTYAYRGGERVSTLRGQRSADELLEWLGTQLADGAATGG